MYVINMIYLINVSCYETVRFVCVCLFVFLYEQTGFSLIYLLNCGRFSLWVLITLKATTE